MASTIYDRKTFFDGVRVPIFRAMSDPQVEGCKAILAEAERRAITDTRQIAYMLATVFWETGRTMRPVREVGQGRGKDYGARDAATGQIYYGRGLVQLTWKANYSKMSVLCDADLVNNPDLALQPDIACKILFVGMLLGTFTGKKLGDYFTASLTDWVNARHIINGTDQANTIAVFAQQFNTALRTSLQTAPVVASLTKPVVAEPTAGIAPDAAPKVGLVARLKQFIGITHGENT